jgi:muramoyltetrapeptide carboxypeptidase
MTILKPPRLNKGDLIGIVSPASPINDPTNIDRGVRYLESLGYRTLVGAHARNVLGYLAGSDEERLSDLHTMFADKKVKAIFCVRGGYGTPRLLRLLNYRLIARNPKILLGFSDITAIQLALWKRCRLVTFHGPMLGVDMAGTIDPFSEETLWRMLTSAKKGPALEFRADEGLTYREGKAVGCLLGGNLSLVVNLIGTKELPVFMNAVLFLEEIGEEPYRIDRMLTQMRNTGVLKGIKGVLGGRFIDCVPKDPKIPSRTTEEILQELAELLRVPFLAGLPFGHTTRKLTLPVGIRVKVDVSKRRIEFLESAVS